MKFNLEVFMKRILTVLLPVAVVGQALGAGFALFEQGAAALGRGGAFVAGVNDASANFFNPAGLAFSPNELQVGLP
jgi:long-chain fatty acid transport protein